LVERFKTSREKIWIVPNGVNLPDIRHRCSIEELPEPVRRKKLVLFLGKTNYPPNAEAIRVIEDELASRARRDLVFVIVGGPHPPDYSRVDQGLAFTGFVEDLRPLLQQATACIAPLLSGSGTRLKILEYAANSKPIIATRVAVEGLNFVHGKDIAIADDWDEFMRAVFAIVDGNIDTETMAHHARQKVADEYQWQAIAASYQKNLLALISSDPAFRRVNIEGELQSAARNGKEAAPVKSTASPVKQAV
jgi:glycosyltransferase involved in cell wall biosynthesis